MRSLRSRGSGLLGDDQRVGVGDDARLGFDGRSDVLGQVETAAQRNNVTLTGLQAVKASIKSPSAAKLYEREIPAVVTGPYPQVVRFFNDISRMPRILLVRDYSVVSLKSGVSAGFTLVAYHAPPPAEMPGLPKDLVSSPTNTGGQQ